MLRCQNEKNKFPRILLSLRLSTWESDKEIDWLDHHCLKASYELNIRTVLSNYLFSDLAMKEPIIQNETRCEV